MAPDKTDNIEKKRRLTGAGIGAVALPVLIPGAGAMPN